MRQAAALVFLFCLSSQFSCQRKPYEKRHPTLSYAQLEKLNIKIPYVRKYGKVKQLLVYGSNHTQNPQDPEVRDIEKKIADFVPDVILYEGDGISTEQNKNETVSTYFELGLVKYIADSLKIAAVNIEPPTHAKFNYLMTRYSKDEILLATLGLQITLMQHSNSDFVASYPAMIKSLVIEGLPLTEGEQTLSHFYNAYKKYFHRDFSYANFDATAIQAKYNKTSLNKLNQEANDFRDQHIISLIVNLFHDYNKIYLQIGGWHAIVCQPAFEQITQAENP